MMTNIGKYNMMSVIKLLSQFQTILLPLLYYDGAGTQQTTFLLCLLDPCQVLPIGGTTENLDCRKRKKGMHSLSCLPAFSQKRQYQQLMPPSQFSEFQLCRNPLLSICVSFLTKDCMQTGWLRKRNLFSHGSAGYKSKNKVQVSLAPSAASLLSVQMSIFSFVFTWSSLYTHLCPNLLLL